MISGGYNAKDVSNHCRCVADCRIDNSDSRSGRALHPQISDRVRVPAGEQFRKASHSLASPSVEQQNWSDYSEGHPPVNDSDLTGTRRRHRIKRIGPEVAFRESRRQSDQVTGRNHNCRREFQSAPTKTSIGSG